MTRHRADGWRQGAALLALAAGLLVTVATSAAYQETESTSSDQSLEVDAGHGLAYAPFIVRIGADAAAGLDRAGVTVVIDRIDSEAGARGSAGRYDAVALRVEAVDPEREAGLSPVATPNPYPGTNTEGPWLFDPGPSSVEVPVSCTAPGPCERAFRLVATIGDASVTRARVTWHLTSQLTYGGLAYPSAAAATFTVGEPVAIAGPPPQLDVSTPPERIVLGPDHPVVARLADVIIPASRLPADRPRPSAYLATTLLVDTPPPGAVSTGPDASMDSTLPTVSIQQVEASGTRAPQPAPMGGIAGALDPVSSCTPGRDCTTRVLVTIAWTGGGPVAYRWQLALHWADASSVVSAGSGRTRLAVVRSIETRAAPVGRLAVEGDVTSGGTASFTPHPVPSERELGLATVLAVVDPGLRDIVPLLPVPAVVRVRITADVTAPADLHAHVAPMLPQAEGAGTIETYFRGTTLTSAGNPLLGCGLGNACPLQVTVDANATDRSLLRAHWTVEVELYAYVGVDATLESTP